MKPRSSHDFYFSVLCFPAAGTIVFLFIGIMISGPFQHVSVMLSALCAALSAVFLLFDSVRTLKNEFFSVKSAFLPGLCLFAFSLTLIDLCLAAQLSGLGGLSDWLILWRLLRIAVLFTVPAVCLFSVLLIISNVVSAFWLIKNGRAKSANIQGFLSAAVLCGGCALIIFADRIVPEKAAVVMCAVSLLFFFAECLLCSALVILRAAESHRPPFDRDFLIILGCGLYPDGRPSTMLQNRMKAAQRFYQEQLRQTGKQTIFIASGGQGPDEARSEAAAMKSWLTENGVSEDRILMEDRSRSTEENMAFSKAIIDEILPGARCAFCTTNFHAFRAGIKAYRIGLRADGITYQTEWYFWYNAAVREVVGLLAEMILKK